METTYYITNNGEFWGIYPTLYMAVSEGIELSGSVEIYKDKWFEIEDTLILLSSNKII